MRQWLQTAVFLVIAGLLPGQAAASCAVHQDLSNLHRATKGFLSYLSSGQGAFNVPRLQSWLSENPPAALRKRMRAVGIQTAEPGTLELIRQHKVLLQVLAAQGRSTAGETARLMNIHMLAAQVGGQLEALPCDQSKDPGTGSKLVAVAATDAHQREQIINAAIAWVSFLVLGGSVLYFLDRIGIRKIRRTKRYPCAVPCVVQAGRRSVRAQLVDLSRAGAKVHPDTPGEFPGRVTLRFGGHTVEAQVRWQTADYIGVKFVKDFNFLQLHRLLEAFPMEDPDAKPKGKRLPPGIGI